MEVYVPEITKCCKATFIWGTRICQRCKIFAKPDNDPVAESTRPGADDAGISESDIQDEHKP